MNRLLSNTLRQYYGDAERERMRAELTLIDPILLHGAREGVLDRFGKEAIKKLLSFYGAKQKAGDIEFDPLIDCRSCYEEYQAWKLLAERESGNMDGLSPYDRIMSWYGVTAAKCETQFLHWFKLYRLILLNWSSSMSLERLFRARKLYQPATCSNYSYQGLSDRLVLHHNSAKQGTADSVILYMKAQKKWYVMKKRRIYSAVSPLFDFRLRL